MKKLTSLSDTNHVMVRQKSWNGISLNGRRVFITAKLDIVVHNRVEAGIFELQTR